jgi:hypothetical protein
MILLIWKAHAGTRSLDLTGRTHQMARGIAYAAQTARKSLVFNFWRRVSIVHVCTKANVRGLTRAC